MSALWLGVVVGIAVGVVATLVLMLCGGLFVAHQMKAEGWGMDTPDDEIPDTPLARRQGVRPATTATRRTLTRAEDGRPIYLTDAHGNVVRDNP